ncbi:MAG: hypothetical protein ABIE68_02660 [bacterium]
MEEVMNNNLTEFSDTERINYLLKANNCKGDWVAGDKKDSKEWISYSKPDLHFKEKAVKNIFHPSS